MIISRQVNFQFGKKKTIKHVDRIPAISRMMALAIYYEKLIQSGNIQYITDIAKLEGITQARVSQIFSLLNLNFRIQEKILTLPREYPPCKSYSIKAAIKIAKVIDFERQDEMFEKVWK